MAVHVRVWLAVGLIGVATAANAGAPLKGVDVKLGKNPGGNVASRTTDAAGEASFGSLPALPQGTAYTVAVAAGRQAIDVTVKGASGGPLAREIAPRAPGARAAEAIRFEADGASAITVRVEAAGGKTRAGSADN